MAKGNLMQWLEGLAYLTAILGGCAAALHFLIKHRRGSIASLKSALIRTWTNEGDITSDEEQYVTLEVEDDNGDLIASVSFSSEPSTFDAHIEVGWGKALLQIKGLVRRTVYPVATVRLTLTGNNNRLAWKLESKQVQMTIPERTLLWPDMA
jgi:hypothetical protein